MNWFVWMLGKYWLQMLVWIKLNIHPKTHFPYEKKQAEAHILAHFNIQSLEVFQIHKMSITFPAIVAVLDYLDYTQKSSLRHIHQIQPRLRQHCCDFDQGVIDHLDLFKKEIGVIFPVKPNQNQHGIPAVKGMGTLPAH